MDAVSVISRLSSEYNRDVTIRRDHHRKLWVVECAGMTEESTVSPVAAAMLLDIKLKDAKLSRRSTDVITKG